MHTWIDEEITFSQEELVVVRDACKILQFALFGHFSRALAELPQGDRINTRVIASLEHAARQLVGPDQYFVHSLSDPGIPEHALTAIDLDSTLSAALINPWVRPPFKVSREDNLPEVTYVRHPVGEVSWHLRVSPSQFSVMRMSLALFLELADEYLTSLHDLPFVTQPLHHADRNNIETARQMLEDAEVELRESKALWHSLDSRLGKAMTTARSVAKRMRDYTFSHPSL